MSDREPTSIDEFFAAEYADASPPDPENADEVADLAPEGSDADPTPPTQDAEPDRLAAVEQQLEQMRLESERKDKLITDMITSARQTLEQERAKEVQQYQYRWQQGLATGELSEVDVYREREQLMARHATDRIRTIEAENIQLRERELERSEREAKVQVIDYLVKEFKLSDQERAYISVVKDPYDMEELAKEIRQSRPANRGRRPVDQGTGSTAGAARGTEPKSMAEYFSRVHAGSRR
jgi:hypothetical protein